MAANCERANFLIALWFACIMVARAGRQIKFYNLTKLLEPEDLVQTNLRFNNVDNNLIVNGEIKQLQDFDDEWKVHVTILYAHEANQQYVKIFQLLDQGVCLIMKTFYKFYFYESFKKYANAPDPNKCPIEKTTYIIKDYPMDIMIDGTFLNPGYYRILVDFLKDKVEKLKYIIEGHVE